LGASDVSGLSWELVTAIHPLLFMMNWMTV
jgi:hypothetical protein